MEPKCKWIKVAVPEDLHDKLKKAAIDHKLSLKQWILDTLKLGVRATNRMKP